MTKSYFEKIKRSIIIIGIFSVLHSGCASRTALIDEKGQPIKQSEVDKVKTNNNAFLHALGGGALSFGASFFAGSMINRGISDDDGSQTPLWVITGLGTAVGTALFAQTGRVHDHNQAVETVKEMRQFQIKKKITNEKSKQTVATSKRKEFEKARQRQEREKEELLRRIREKQSQGN